MIQSGLEGAPSARAKASVPALLALGVLVATSTCAPHPGLGHRPVDATRTGDPHDASPPQIDGAGFDGGALDGAPGSRLPDSGAWSSESRTEDAASSDAAPGGPSEQVRRHFPSQLSFLLITVDTLRPDLGYMGYQQPVSPNIDRLAERAVVYEHAYAISTYTGFCLPPMMASRYPSEMPRTDRHEVKYLRDNVMLAERLRAAGYHTAGAASHFLFAPELGWIDGFERFRQVPGEGNAPPGARIDRLHSSRGLADAAIQLLADPHVTSGPFFIWVHFLDPHKLYLEHPGFSNYGSEPRALYDGEVAYTDFHIGRVLDALAASPLHERTAVVLTADHGEAFGEHGELFHGSEVWDEIVRVPLVVSVPGLPPRRIHRRASEVELAPTILDLAGLPEDPNARGKSFAVELFGGELPEPPILIDQPHNPYYETRRAFIERNYKLHHYPESNTYLLFDLARDPGELHDLTGGEPELFKRQLGSYAAFMASVPQVTPRPIAPSPPPPKPPAH